MRLPPSGCPVPYAALQGTGKEERAKKFSTTADRGRLRREAFSGRWAAWSLKERAYRDPERTGTEGSDGSSCPDLGSGSEASPSRASAPLPGLSGAESQASGRSSGLAAWTALCFLVGRGKKADEELRSPQLRQPTRPRTGLARQSLRDPELPSPGYEQHRPVEGATDHKKGASRWQTPATGPSFRAPKSKSDSCIPPPRERVEYGGSVEK
ncbi:hypothetical protein NDU88_002041 [Pleurodeles waltl]|uniref:Uncharacterized protein n=1 Tax=Pleurodeles waltl TaxID=8319 RepID=A0AAV7NFZ2_PLEWA|nr:hypothetical protein NDU88_002041 [Pleurodeles waltl]